jgi:hypothetical protein
LFVAGQYDAPSPIVEAICSVSRSRAARGRSGGWTRLPREDVEVVSRRGAMPRDATLRLVLKRSTSSVAEAPSPSAHRMSVGVAHRRRPVRDILDPMTRHVMHVEPRDETVERRLVANAQAHMTDS